MGMKEWRDRSQGVVLMLVVQVIATGLELLSKVTLGHGQFIFALLAYRHLVGALCVAPFAFFLERGKAKELSWSTGLLLFMSALTGISMAMGLFYYGLRDTTATYATNFLSLIPIATFVLSTILRIEKLRLGTRAGRMKTMGAILCLAGALTVSLYKGKLFYIGNHITHRKELSQTVHHNWTRGTIFLVLSILSCAMWYMVQVKLSKSFPYKYWATMFTCMIASVQGAVVGLCVDRKKASWALGWNLELVTIVYSGMLATAATFCLISWAVANRGPTYPSMFYPLALIFVTISEALFLGEPIAIGSLIGMSLIIVGLYSFLWGKSKESKDTTLPEVAIVIEASGVVLDNSAAFQTSAIVIPTASPGSTTAAVAGRPLFVEGC